METILCQHGPDKWMCNLYGKVRLIVQLSGHPLNNVDHRHPGIPQLFPMGPLVLDGVADRLRALDPARIVVRGWSITRRADGSLVRSVADVSPGDPLVTRVAGGTVTSTVDATSADDPGEAR